MHKAALLPISALADTRLNRSDLAVLAAICTFYRHRRGNQHPTRKDISGLAGVDERAVSRATTRLTESNWLMKDGKGGRHGAATYQVNWLNPVNSDRVSDGVNPDKSDRVSALHNPVNSDRVSNPDNSATVSGINPDELDRVTPGNPDKSVTPIYLTGEESSNNNLPISSESVVLRARATDFRFGDVVSILLRAGMPQAFVNNADDRKTILEWTVKYTREQVEEACRKGVETKANRNDETPIGVRYVNMILENTKRLVTTDEIGNAWVQQHG